MVLCWVALPIFAILSIFSVRYRRLTLDSLDCMFRTLTLRKCSSGLDDKIRSDITGTFLKISPKAAKFFYKNYKVISWIVLIVLLWSFYAGVSGIVNYAKYGNCNGPDSDGFCIFDPLGQLGEEDMDILADDLGVDREMVEGCVLNHTSLEECSDHCRLGR